MSRAKIAAAPISWGQCEVPGWGHQMARERVLYEMAALGIHATEAGPDGFLPDDPSELRDLLAASEMALVGGYTPLVLRGDDGRWRDQIETVARRFAAAGGEVIVLAAATGLADYDARPELSSGDWTLFLRARVFRPLGDGDLDLRTIIDSARAAGYSDWYVMEQDVMLTAEPAQGQGPYKDVARSLACLERSLTEVSV
jgi:inosose dehydratase